MCGGVLSQGQSNTRLPEKQQNQVMLIMGDFQTLSYWHGDREKLAIFPEKKTLSLKPLIIRFFSLVAYLQISAPLIIFEICDITGSTSPYFEKIRTGHDYSSAASLAVFRASLRFRVFILTR